jgi:preprotein translocase subunit SecE
LFFLLQWTADWIWGYFTRTPDELYITIFAALTALFVGVYFYKREQTYQLVNEVAAELKKVTWPTSKEVKSATIVVVIMTIISASILGIFDIVWSKVTELIYG